MKFISFITVLLLAALPSSSAAETKPLRALLITGGCCHDYAKQHEILSQGIQARANVQVDVIWTDDKSTNPPLPVYDNADWAKGYDVIIHDECAASMTDKAVLTRILDTHKTIPSVQLHCAMHSFRTGEDRWFKRLGLQSNSHGPQEPIAISFVDKEHPITQPLADWTTIKEELYNNVNLFDAHPLAMGRQTVKNKDGSTKDVEYIVAWTNEKAGARSFSTTIGHNNETVADARYLDLVTRGLLWACDKLNADHLKPFTGKNTVTFVKGKPPEAPKPAPATAAPPPPPKDATLVTVTASSEESGKGNFTWKAVDGSTDTRWCAGDSSKPQWFQLEFDKPQSLTGCSIVWESRNNAYQHKVEASTDGKAWTMLADATQNKTGGDSSHTFVAKDVRFVKVTCTGTSSGGWASVREITLKGEGIKALAAKMTAQQQTAAEAEAKTHADPYKDQGNVTPKIVKLTSEQEAAILKDVTVPEGFDATLFANSAAANYPVFIAAAPNGDLYVSSDGNGSLGRNPHRGRILRLRDKDNDGRADEVTEFVKDLDAPRGLVWDHDRLYVVHPPDLSVFIDKDGDGVAEERKELVKGIAFGYDQRPADHTTNGLSLGIDGWLYIAGGDFGFMDAVGTDGRHLQHRGGGVIRVRPDGTGLEIYSTGTRNILEVAISPTMEIFARDNTNDGGGWNVRFHHFTGMDDHGYPRLFKNFPDECIAPLADYGGGSGCGAVYIDEPGFGDWNNAPFTCDWGTGALYKHTVKPKGATFEETEAPKPFIKMTRPTDADVDAMSRVYCASWKGATFNWEGPDVGYIVCVKPKGWTLAAKESSAALQRVKASPGQATANPPNASRDGLKPTTTFLVEPLPDFAKAADEELVKLLESSSNRRRMEAQRELLRRQNTSAFPPLAEKKDATLATRCAAILGITQELRRLQDGVVPSPEQVSTTALSSDPSVSRFLLRGLDDRIAAVYPVMVSGGVISRISLGKDDLFTAVVRSASQIELDPRSKLELARVASRNGVAEPAQIANWLGDSDPAITHVTVNSLRYAQQWWGGVSRAGKVCADLARSEHSTPLQVKNAFRALQGMHDPRFLPTDPYYAPLTGDTSVVELVYAEGYGRDSKIAINGTERRKAWLAMLCRLYYKEGKWQGDSWGTRPDTRGPYYQPEPWGETPKIEAELKHVLSTASPEEAAFLVAELNRNRIQFNEALDRILALAAKDPKLIPDAVGQLATAESVPASAIPLLIQAAQTPDASPQTLSQAITALAKTDSAEGCRASLTALVTLSKSQGSGKEQEAGRTAFLDAPKLENHHQLLETEAEKLGSPTALWADMALLNLSARASGSPESRELSGKALETGWQNPQRRAQILKAVAQSKHNPYADKVLAALDDPDNAVAAAAKNAANAMKLKKREKSNDPVIATMKPEDVIAQVINTHGDIELGEQLFTRQTCVACHTVSADQPPKGPYLGNIAQTYKRPDLAQNILDPNKTIAQGFATNVFTLKDGSMNMGFVTDESGDKVTMRNIAAQEFTYKKPDITKRDTLPASMMPPGLVFNLTVKEFASLLDYLESLAKK